MKVVTGIGQMRRVACQCRLGLPQRRLERTRIDLGDQAAGLHRLAFDEADLVDGPSHLGSGVAGSRRYPVWLGE